VTTAFAPATVANVACGFDLIGFAIEGIGDRVSAERRGGDGVTLAEVTGDGGALPREAERNTAGVAVRELLKRRKAAGEETCGISLRLEKGMPLASGLGSSAASAVAAVVAVNALFERPSPAELLLRCAMEGERAACGTAHADNAAPSLFGGLVLVRGEKPRVDPLVVAPGLFSVVVHPHREVRTEDARAVLPGRISTVDALTQAGNLAALVAGLAAGDDDLIASALYDVIAEPARAQLVPGFPEGRDAAIEAGALGGGLSGSGPSQFALARGREAADRVAARMAEVIGGVAEAATDVYISPLPAAGARLVEDHA
jgi:homoserine kinase